MKGMLLAGGTGSRLFPNSLAISKHLIPLHDKPMIYYSLATLMLRGVQTIVLVVDPFNEPNYRRLLGDGGKWGLDIQIVVQREPNGIAGAILLGQEHIGLENFSLILGDNFFFGSGFGGFLQNLQHVSGATVFASRVESPENYGVVSFNEQGLPVSIEEKPAHPKSNYAITGLYLYDHKVFDIAREVRPSKRGELEITDINLEYMQVEELNVARLPRGTTWIDAGTLPDLADASELVRSVQRRQPFKIGCPEEIAWRMGFIDDSQLERLAAPLTQSGYGQYLLELLKAET